MLEHDLIACLRPAPNRFTSDEWWDACARISHTAATNERFTFRGSLEPGLYKGRMESSPEAFAMETAMVEMTRVPDGARVPIGPWDLNHMDNVMAVPMAIVRVNDIEKGGLWFNVPGPEQIREGRLSVDFGFESEGGETEVTFDLLPRDLDRFSWQSLASVDLRRDERVPRPLVPVLPVTPRIYFSAADQQALHQNPKARAHLEEARGQIPDDIAEWQIFPENNRSHFDRAVLLYAILGDVELGERSRTVLLQLCRKPTWSGRPDPLLMGGDNDRGVGHSLYLTGLGWEFLRPLLNEEDRVCVQAKAQEYLQKMYDFTVLQRGYMGCPSPDAHSLGTWYGVGVACMAFYDDLPIARRALPFFHGLFLDALALSPSGGKAAWATYYPSWLARYFAAASVFGGEIPEVTSSLFFENLGPALLASFLCPNSQETQRGLRTVEHRILSAFLCRFHPRENSAAIYQTFVAEETRQAGDLEWTIFDLLYAPTETVAPAELSTEPLFARDIGQIIVGIPTDGGRLGITIDAGMKSGARASFSLPAHNREHVRSLGSLEVSCAGRPVLINIDGYGLFSAKTNAPCFGDGGGIADGQYLHGEIAPEKRAFIRRCYIEERFVYVDVLLTGALQPELEIDFAQRTILLDRQTGIIFVSDSFSGRKPLRYGTHLHCSGSVTQPEENVFRLTGGQANRIAGIKFGDMGLSDEEHSELFATVLSASAAHSTTVEEASWFPNYIYGLNGGGNRQMEKARFPHYQRWRFALGEETAAGSLRYALHPKESLDVEFRDELMAMPNGEEIHLDGLRDRRIMECLCTAEAAVADINRHRLLLFGATSLTTSAGASLAFHMPVDLDLDLGREGPSRIFSPIQSPLSKTSSLVIEAFQTTHNHPRSSQAWEAEFSL